MTLFSYKYFFLSENGKKAVISYCTIWVFTVISFTQYKFGPACVPVLLTNFVQLKKEQQKE